MGRFVLHNQITCGQRAPFVERSGVPLFGLTTNRSQRGRIAMKTCGKCRMSKPLGSFNRHSQKKDGRQGYCRECMKAYHKSKQCRRTERRYKKSLQGRTNRLRRENSPEGREATKQYRRCYERQNREKKRAHKTTARAVNAGQLAPVMTLKCADCSTGATAYHHEDYNLPLAVIALCRQCHVNRHTDSQLKGDTK